MTGTRHPRLKAAAAAARVTPMTLALAGDEGTRLLDHRGLAGLRAALDPLLGASWPSVLEAVGVGDGWTLFWLGFVQQFDDWRLACRSWREAERRFAAAGDTWGAELANGGLIQCGHFDQQPIDQFERRCERALNATHGGALTTPLDLFRAASRMLATTYWSDKVADDDAGRAEQFERAFAALATGVDAELRLRLATAALAGIRRSFDRLRARDFHAAGSSVAALPEVGAYSRLQWLLWMMYARNQEPMAAGQLVSEFDALVGPEPSGPCRTIAARAQLYCAQIEMNRGDPAATRARLDAAHPLLDPAYANDYALFHSIASRHALLGDDYEAAAAHASLCLEKLREGAAAPTSQAVALNDSAFAQAALGRYEEAIALFTRSAALDQGESASFASCHLHLTRALQRWREGSMPEGRAELHAGFAQARRLDAPRFFRFVPRLAAQVCEAAFELDVEPDFARAVVAKRALACTDVGVANWPWRLSVRALGGLSIEREGRAFQFGRKAPKRLLDVLRATVALGGRQVDARRLAALLWPDADGDEAWASLKAMLHRLRALLGSGSLGVRDGQITFDEHQVWIDTWAFEHVGGRIESLLSPGLAMTPSDEGELERRRLQLFALYRGHFLGEADVPSWALPMRDRLRARFVRAIEAMGQWLEARARHDSAITLYRTALEHDNLAEELYQRLIACHLARGEAAQAFNAYRRCRELLSIVLGLKPSTRTEELVGRIASR